MKQLPGIIMAIIATVIILVALIVSGLLIALPHLDKCSQQIVSILNSNFNTNIKLHTLHGSWQYFGPTLDIYGIEATTNYGRMYVQHATLALDFWQSLRDWRWKFRDVIFYSLQLDLNPNLINSNYHSIPIRDALIDHLFLLPFDQFILRNSHFTFIPPSGRLFVISVPQLTCFNTVHQHRAEGKITISSNEAQHGMIEASIELHDDNGLINNGKFYLNPWNINLQQLFRPLMSINTNITLQRTYLNFSACLTIDNGNITSADAMLSQGIVFWDHNDHSYRFDVDKLSIKLYKQQDAWQLDVPALNIAINGQSWSSTAISIFWLPAKCNCFLPDQTGEIGLRLSRLNFELFNPILSLISVVTPKFSARWYELKPCGKLTSLALDIPLNNTSATRFQAEWYNLSWRPWRLMPGAEKFAGSVSGSLAAGRLKLALQNSMLPYPRMFRAPLAISNAYATIDWRHNQQDGLVLWGHNINIRAKSIWVKGNFSFHKSIIGETWLDILAGWHLTNAADAWRYYPEPLIGKNLADYLTSAIKSGHIANANLLFTGNPSRFPFKNNAGKLEVWVPLRQAAYIFESGWPALKLLDIDLNFVNNGLFIYTPQIMLGKNISNISANIQYFSKKKLFIHAHINSSGSDIRDYVLKTPLKLSLCKTLEELQLSGVVMGDFYFDIPLNDKSVTASGNIVLNNNSLYIKSLSTTFESINGKLCYSNGNVKSYAIDGKWFGQPIVINVTSIKKYNCFNINIGIKGNWSLKALPNLPIKIRKTFSGNADWNSNIVITIPLKGEMHYNIVGKSDFKNINSSLPAPLYKNSGTPLTLVVNIQGDMHAFLMSGHLGKLNSFNSHWSLKRQITLKRGAWEYSSKIPNLPQDKKIILSLPAIDGDKWLKLLKYPHSMEDVQTTMWLLFPETMTLRTPALTLGRQIWHKLGLTCSKIAGSMKVTIHGQEIHGTLTIFNHSPWRAELSYLYYNPLIYESYDAYFSELFHTSDSNTLAYWQKILVTCQQCWIKKKNIGRLSAIITSIQDKLILNSFILDTGKMYLTADGHWLHNSKKNQTAFKGTLSGHDIGDAADYLGCNTLLHDTTFNINYNLHWCAVPWAPEMTSIKGVLHTKLGKGKIDHISNGSAGYIIHLMSFDALMRKLKFNFSDTLGKGFYFHTIKGISWLKNGKLHTNEILIDGIDANVAISGYLDIKQQHININVVIVPEILAIVGLATAVIIHPVLGGAVFAASKILTPLCNKLSLVCYHISGNLAMPKIKQIRSH